MPSLAAVQELRENTNYEWTKRNGVWGGKLTSKINGKSIFLPAEDYDAGIYFTSSMDKYDVVCINFFDGSLGITYVTPDVMHPVRAVIGDMPYVPVESVDFGYTSSFLEVGQIDYLHVDILPQNATNKKLTWSSSDENVVSVDSRGYVTAVGVGSAIITAEADGKKDEIIVEVEPHYTIYIEPGSLNLKVGQSETITVTLSPELPPKYCGVTTTGNCFHAELISDTYPYTYRITGLTEGVGELSFYTSPLTRATCTITVTNN